MTVAVAWDDIRHPQARRNDCWRCPLARAASRAWGTTVIVTATHLIVGDRRYPLPAEGREFVRRADHGEPLTPITLTVEAEA